ncbi:MAG: hypothetical protein KIT22_01340 [Verrucomicrobiae bacterium]|nr:hypothetical protein [Verrucomicrobiae bacterium]
MRFETNDLAVTRLQSAAFEDGDVLQAGGIETRAGGGDMDSVEMDLAFPPRQIQPIAKAQAIWEYLLAHSDPDTVRRLRQDPGFRPDGRRWTVRLDPEGTRGFTLTADQLLSQKAFWFPELDLFIATGESPESFAQYQAEQAPFRGLRILDQLESEPEATYEQYLQRWEDMGNPGYQNSSQIGPGHIVCLAWDGSLDKFGIDRGGGVWNDYGTTNGFRLFFDFSKLDPELARSWRGQRLTDGLPLIVTRIERRGSRGELEQFAYPLGGVPPQRRGDVPVVLCQRLRLTELEGKPREVTLGLTQTRRFPDPGSSIELHPQAASWIWSDSVSGGPLLSLQGESVQVRAETGETSPQTNRCTLVMTLAPSGSATCVMKLAYAALERSAADQLLALNYDTAREQTIRFWSELLDRGAQFVVPEEAVNTLYRASLWHAMRLPRRHGADAPGVGVDLPYANFAYDQQGTPWPVNQSVYVDHLIYDLRGYHDFSSAELAMIFRNNQESSGHVGGFANWGVYTPSMLYTVAQQFLLSGDRVRLEALLPQSLKAMDWCLAEIDRNRGSDGTARGLMLAPLNDLTREAQAWAFNQSYLQSGLELFGRVLAEIGHARAAECRAAATALRAAIARAFGEAARLSPAVQLRDHTWIPYVPADALTPRRMPEIWYPTDIDTGALHLSRLKALDPAGALTGYLLNDHEDNLFYRGWGMANEPVYNQHALAYLHQDRIKPAIRAFYSMLACAFSHSVFEPVEHRWGWGQYFGPPSTDGAWLDLYRHLLIQESDNGALVLCPAAPQRWFEDGKQIRIERAPTYFGELNLNVASHANRGEIVATIALARRRSPSALLVRLRHPEGRPVRSVLVNEQNWTQFDADSGTIRLPEPTDVRYTIRATY